MKTIRPTSIEATVYGEHGSALDGLAVRMGLDWIYVVDSTTAAWSNSTNYNSGDVVKDGLTAFTCTDSNTNVEPGVATEWGAYWEYLGPIFQNGFMNEGGSWVPMRFRYQLDGNVDLEGCAIGGPLHSPIFTLDDSTYIPDFDTPKVVTNSTFGFAVLVIHTDGTVTREA